MYLTEHYTKDFNMVLIRHIYILFVSMQFHVCDAGVNIQVSPIINRINTDQDQSITVYYVSTAAGEVNDATCEWQQTTRTPIFEYYYTHVYVPGSGGTTVTNSDIEWNPMRTSEELKDAGGEVICTARFDEQPKASKAFTIIIHSKPGMTVVLRNPALGNIIRDSTLIMTCSGDKGYPTGIVTWNINGTEMTGDSYMTDVITINEVQAENDGNWSCYFTNALGIGGESEIQTVEVKWQPAPCDLTLNPDDDYIDCTRTLILTCTCPDKGRPMGEINLSLNGLTKTGTMYLDDVITIDSVESQHAGEWECYYKNEIGIGTPSSKTINVKCRPTGQAELVADRSLVTRGQTVRLECKGDPGSPKDKVLLILDSNVVGVVIADDENTWNITPSRNGTWSCLFMNELGNGTESDGVPIGVLCRPTGQAELVADRSLVKRGQTVRLECKGDPGSPKDKVLLILDSNVVGVVIADDENTWNITPSRNGTWSCLFMNEFGNGTESNGVAIGVLLTPLPPNIDIYIRTAVNLAINVTSSESFNKQSYHYKNITLAGYGYSFSTIQPANISEYTFYNLQPETSYNISVFYNNEFGDGDPASVTYTTKPSPVSVTPTITRNWLTALVEMTIDYPDSASEIEIIDCHIGETDTSKCNKETVIDIEADFREVVPGSLSSRLVNVSIYDTGVLVYSYGDAIGAAVVVIILIVLAGVVLVIFIIVIFVAVIKKRANSSTQKENIVQYDNVVQAAKISKVE